MQRNPIRLIATLALAILVTPLAVRAQHADQMRKIGVLQPYAEHDPEGQRRFAALIRGLQNLGWQEGRNMTWQARSPFRPLARPPPAFLLSWQRSAIS